MRCAGALEAFCRAQDSHHITKLASLAQAGILLHLQSCGIHQYRNKSRSQALPVSMRQKGSLHIRLLHVELDALYQGDKEHSAADCCQLVVMLPLRSPGEQSLYKEIILTWMAACMLPRRESAGRCMTAATKCEQ